MENMIDSDFAVFALNRMCKPADSGLFYVLWNNFQIKKFKKGFLETKVTVHYTDELEDMENKDEVTWIVSAQSSKQKSLLRKHKQEIPIFVEGPYYCWIISKMVEN